MALFLLTLVACSVDDGEKGKRIPKTGKSEATDSVAPKPKPFTLELLEAYLAIETAERPPLSEQTFADQPLTREQAVMAEQLLWQDHVKRIRAERAAEMKARKIKDGDMIMPFYYRVVGEKLEGGRSLFISMHGGGGGPAQMNDQQWRNQVKLYQPKEGVYLVPRAPTNTWNLWHQSHIDRMFARLIENLVVFEGVNPNKVYIMGYSAGGDGVYQLAPRMADRLAAAAMMAGHPNETSPLGLRNVPFTLHMGGKDAAYKRNKIAAEWKVKLAELQKADPKGYVHLVKIYPESGHWMNRQDAVALPWMAKYTRNPFPEHIVWKQDDVTHARFYWLAVDKENTKARSEVIATLNAQNIDVQSKDINRLIIRVSDQMLDMDQTITVKANGKEVFKGRVNRTIQTIASTLNERGDSKAVFSGEVTVDIAE